MGGRCQIPSAGTVAIKQEYFSCLAAASSLVFLAQWLTQGLVKTVKTHATDIIIYLNNG